jgi:hypothetical protein
VNRTSVKPMKPVKFLRAVPLAIAFGLAGCGSSPSPPPQVFAPLNYSYLPPIVLNVSNVTVQNNYVPDANAATLLGEDPEAPANALTDMAQRRLVANGTPGNATFTVETASINQIGDNLIGLMTVRLDVISADGRNTGYTEASVSVTQTAPDPNDTQNPVQAALYGLTKQLMDQMNVQLQYQIQRNLASWISYTPNAAAPALNSGAPSIGGGIQAVPLDVPGTSTTTTTTYPTAIPP